MPGGGGRTSRPARPAFWRALCAAALLWPLAAWPLEEPKAIPPKANSGLDDLSVAPTREDVIKGLVERLVGGKAEASDAAIKLRRTGRAAVPFLLPILRNAPSNEARLQAAYALAGIRHPAAAQALLPYLKDAKAPRELRLLAVSAAGCEDNEEALEVLRRLAADRSDPELRTKALQTLTIAPNAWKDCEKLFVGGLDDPDPQIQLLSLQACFLATAYKLTYSSAEPKLMELAEKGPDDTLRCKAVYSLARMKSGLAVAQFVKLLGAPETPPGVARALLEGLRLVTGVALKDGTAAQTWWEKFGRDRYGKAEPIRPPPPPPEAPAVAERPAPPKPEAPPAHPPAKRRPLDDDAPPPPPAKRRPLGEEAPPPPYAGAAVDPPAPPAPAKRKALDDEPSLPPFHGAPMGAP